VACKYLGRLPQLRFLIFFDKIFLVNLINHNLSGVEISAFYFILYFFGDYFKIISILEVEIGRNGLGILGVKSRRTSLMIWGGFTGDKNSELVFMPKDWCKATDIVELVHDGQLLQFMGKVSCTILMEDGAPVHQSKVPEEWRKLHLIEKLEWPTNSRDLNPLEKVWKLLKDAIQHGQLCPKTLEELKITLEKEWTLVTSAKLRTYAIPCLLSYNQWLRLKEGILVYLQ
jgi:hypothetical protein